MNSNCTLSQGQEVLTTPTVSTVSFPCITPKTKTLSYLERLTEYLLCMHTLLATCLVIVLLPMQLGENEVYYLNILENME
jgi:hypothetical protein